MDAVYKLPHKTNSLPFHLQILKLPDGVQASNGVKWGSLEKSDITLSCTQSGHFKIYKWKDEEFLFWASVHVVHLSLHEGDSASLEAEPHF